MENTFVHKLSDGTDVLVINGVIAASPVPELIGSTIYEFKVDLAQTVEELEMVYIFKPMFVKHALIGKSSVKLFFRTFNYQDKIVAFTYDKCTYDYRTARGYEFHVRINNKYKLDKSISSIIDSDKRMMEVSSFLLRRCYMTQETKYYYQSYTWFKIPSDTIVGTKVERVWLIHEILNCDTLCSFIDNKVFHVDEKHKININTVLLNDKYVMSIKKGETVKTPFYSTFGGPITVKRDMKGVNLSLIIQELNNETEEACIFLAYFFLRRLRYDFIYCASDIDMYKEGYTFDEMNPYVKNTKLYEWW